LPVELKAGVLGRILETCTQEKGKKEGKKAYRHKKIMSISPGSSQAAQLTTL